MLSSFPYSLLYLCFFVGEQEKQVLDYQMQQLTPFPLPRMPLYIFLTVLFRYRLFPLLATSMAFHFTAKYMQNLYNNFVQGMAASDASVLPEVSLHLLNANVRNIFLIAVCSGACHQRRSEKPDHHPGQQRN